jgi:hypothetical protein
MTRASFMAWLWLEEGLSPELLHKELNTFSTATHTTRISLSFLKA